jgi:hypothetical protein
MTLRFVAVIALSCVNVTLVIACSFLLFAMVGRVNERLSNENKFGYLGWRIGKLSDLLREYRRLYPEGRLATFRRKIGRPE